MRSNVLVPSAILLLSAGLWSTGLKAQAPHDGEGKDLFVARCQTCHALETTTAQHLPENQWRDIVHRMVQNGAQLTEPESETIIAYLAKAYAPEAGPAPATGGKTAHP